LEICVRKDRLERRARVTATEGGAAAAEIKFAPASGRSP
jgi:hypothetical protein